jgi:hypothetical protein
MSKVIELTGTKESPLHLRLDQPLPEEAKGELRLQVFYDLSSDEGAEDEEAAVSPEWKRMTSAEQAADFLKWAESHEGGTGLSDWAVSRDGIYED